MSDEEIFLDGIAADRADRTRLLVFADWLADRDDPRERFIRLHARLLDMDGTEPDFADLEREWAEWTASTVGPDCLPRSAGRLPERWLDALCRLFSPQEAQSFLLKDAPAPPFFGDRDEYSFDEHLPTSVYDSLVLYHGAASDFGSSFMFAAATVLDDIRNNEFFSPDDSVPVLSRPIIRSTFWWMWRERCAELRAGPPAPTVSPDNHFLGAQYASDGWNHWAIVAAYQHDYFALFWSTTD